MTRTLSSLPGSGDEPSPVHQSKPLLKKIPVERPAARANRWWTVSALDWASTSASRQATLSHIGHIMGDEYGAIPDLVYKAGLPRTRQDDNAFNDCRVYSKEAKEKFMQLGDACARCRFDSASCSFKVCPSSRPALSFTVANSS